MSRLPNAPLLEVIFDLRWGLTNNADIIDFQYLHGDLYSSLKGKFPARENLIPPNVPLEVIKGKPVYRFRPKPGDYPLVQIGPGLITVNTVDAKYYWNQFFEEIENVFTALDDIYPKYKDIELHPALTYVDFLEYDKTVTTPQEFINTNLQLAINQEFLESEDARLKEVNVLLNYQVGVNIVSLNIADGKSNDKEGLILQTKVIGQKGRYTSEKLLSWLNESHDLSSRLFKSLTKGALYESFKI